MTSLRLPDPKLVLRSSPLAKIREQLLEVYSYANIYEDDSEDLKKLVASWRLDIPVLRAWLESSAEYLEILLCSALLLEVHQGHESSNNPSEDLFEQVNSRASWDLVGSVQKGRLYNQLRRDSDLEAATTCSFGLPMSKLVKAIQSFCLLCPLSFIESLSHSTGLEEFGHRCRRAFDALQSVIQRHELSIPIRTLADQYIKGSLKLSTVCEILQAKPDDVIRLFERNGFNRSIETLTLAADERERLFAVLRADRLQRKGIVELDHSLAQREVIASERLEGVDARAWLRE